MFLKKHQDFLNENKVDIIKKTAENYLKNYTDAYQNEDGSWSCRTDLNLSYKREVSHNGELSVKFKYVKGAFMIDGLSLTTLKGCPLAVDSFSCKNNGLTSLEYGPIVIKGRSTSGDYSATSNKLTSIKGIAKDIPGFLYLTNNNLTKLDSTVNYVNSINIKNNPLSTLHGKPKVIKNLFWYDFGMDDETNYVVPDKPSLYEHLLMQDVKDKSYRIRGDYWVELLKSIIELYP